MFANSICTQPPTKVVVTGPHMSPYALPPSKAITLCNTKLDRKYEPFSSAVVNIILGQALNGQKEAWAAYRYPRSNALHKIATLTCIYGSQRHIRKISSFSEIFQHETATTHQDELPWNGRSNRTNQSYHTSPQADAGRQHHLTHEKNTTSVPRGA
ncbi:hypothetical protein CC86DRAFT_202717 [Ophiobolus disseminans]|uniref:Uncharacterized protein n=1 Tax=Ophiobolus disseminans TaxID=1469910 RepID=A0A6A7A5H7_9PLEO|nr:hypothetical protein CC86DRAFT_202717 [Ophiobolus disseminans]